MPIRAARIVVLASGSGSTLQAIIDASARGGFAADIVATGSDVVAAQALTRAADAGIETFTVALADFPDRAAWNAALADAIAARRPDLVVLAGFMRVLGPDVVRRFRIVNTHPALLPAFPGAHAIRDALAAGATRTGVTVHWVDEGIDTGPIITQVAVPIEPGDDEDSLRQRVQAAEKALYVQAIQSLCADIGEIA